MAAGGGRAAAGGGRVANQGPEKREKSTQKARKKHGGPSTQVAKITAPGRGPRERRTPAFPDPPKSKKKEARKTQEKNTILTTISTAILTAILSDPKTPRKFG